MKESSTSTEGDWQLDEGVSNTSVHIRSLFLAFCGLLSPGLGVPPGPEARAPVAVVYSGHSMGVSAVAFSANDRVVATGGMDASVRVWEVASGDLLGVFQASGRKSSRFSLAQDFAK